MQNVDPQIAQAFELCKLNAQTDGAFDEKLMFQWFTAAWELCARMIGLEPRQEIKEAICIDDRGGFNLSHRPTSEVRIFDGYELKAIIPPTLIRDRCSPALCCLCNPYAVYWIGQESCRMSPLFLQAVAMLFAYLVENRGDTQNDPHILQRCGAAMFLGPDLLYVW